MHLTLAIHGQCWSRQPTVMAHREIVEEKAARFVTEDCSKLVSAQLGACDVDHLNQQLNVHVRVSGG